MLNVAEEETKTTNNEEKKPDWTDRIELRENEQGSVSSRESDGKILNQEEIDTLFRDAYNGP